MGDLLAIGYWTPGDEAPVFDQQQLLAAVARVRETVRVVQEHATGRLGLGFAGRETEGEASGALPLLAVLPALYPEWLGDRSFCAVHGTRFPYVGGAMANGISSVQMVASLARAGCLGFFGAAGLEPAAVEEAVDGLQRELEPDGLPWGSNLIHSPHEPELEQAVADLYIRRGVDRVSASAYMKLTPAVVHYAAAGLSRAPDGRIVRRHHLFAKISRPEVARHFMEPAPEAIISSLVEQGRLTPEQASLAARVPLAEDVTVEADSGGHTDNQALPALFPVIQGVRDEVVARRGYRRPIRLGAAGGLGTPSAVAAAFCLGAAYVLTGSVNQACTESGLDASGRRLLAQADLPDVMMAPAADMFELGVRVQVLRRGTMFGVRARRLYELYRSHDALEALPADARRWLEAEVFRQPLDRAWQETSDYWQRRDPSEVERAGRDSKHRLALLFRSYLGQSSRWAVTGEQTRQTDFQIWCGPAMGAFNRWTAGSFLAEPDNRSVAQVAQNLVEGAAVIVRAQQLRSHGVAVPAAAWDFRPRTLA